jgi:hypothetical protein
LCPNREFLYVKDMEHTVNIYLVSKGHKAHTWALPRGQHFHQVSDQMDNVILRKGAFSTIILLYILL